ncbi:UNVERIFIED_CONTAM: Ergosterol biosynthetic protein 28 [Sesamum latifolium]|uniref:Ergosterol biosynthetic protein 28 n=1 Tax=Sesamum latifolium TaxID=2727402 RepID=A0AAW2VTY0_9LAMI
MKLLGWWLMLVGTLRLASVWFGFFDIWALRLAVFSQTTMTEVHGRTFGVWTLLTCTLCFLCAFNLDNKPLYLATFLSFIYAFGHFLTEYLIYHTIAIGNLTTVGIFADALVAPSSIILLDSYVRYNIYIVDLNFLLCVSNYELLCGIRISQPRANMCESGIQPKCTWTLSWVILDHQPHMSQDTNGLWGCGDWYELWTQVIAQPRRSLDTDVGRDVFILHEKITMSGL